MKSYCLPQEVISLKHWPLSQAAERAWIGSHHYACNTHPPFRGLIQRPKLPSSHTSPRPRRASSPLLHILSLLFCALLSNRAKQQRPLGLGITQKHTSRKCKGTGRSVWRPRNWPSWENMPGTGDITKFQRPLRFGSIEPSQEVIEKGPNLTAACCPWLS